MRRWILVSLLVVVHLVLHVVMGYGRGAPDLMVVALLIGGRRLRVGQGAALGFGFGLLEDSFSVLSFGANAFAMTATGIAASRSRGLFVGDSTVFVLVYFFGGKLFRDALAWVAADAVSRPEFLTHILVNMPLAALYVAVCGFLIALLLGGRIEAAE